MRSQDVVMDEILETSGGGTEGVEFELLWNKKENMMCICKYLWNVIEEYLRGIYNIRTIRFIKESSSETSSATNIK